MPGVNYTPDVDQLSDSDARDMLIATQGARPLGKKPTTLFERAKYPVMRQWFKKDKMQFQGGKQIEVDVILDENGSAQFVRPYQRKEISQVDVLGRMRVPWTIVSGHYSMEKSEILRNRSAFKLLNLLDARRGPALTSIANQLEAKAWALPDDEDDPLTPCGVPYYIVPITSAQVAAGTSGWQGQNPTGFNSCGGMDSTKHKYRLWRNYNDVWTNNTFTVTEDDVIKMTWMLEMLHFEVPMDEVEFKSGNFDNFRHYTCATVLKALEKKSRSNNDSLGADVGKFAGSTVVKGLPVKYVPELDNSSTLPFLSINHEYFFPFVMEGDYFAESEPKSSNEQHRVFTTHIDTQFNFGIINRRYCGGRIDYVA